MEDGELEHDTLEDGMGPRTVRLLEPRKRGEDVEQPLDKDAIPDDPRAPGHEPKQDKRLQRKQAARREGLPWLHRDNPAIWTGEI